MKKLRVGVIYGGRSGEHEVSLASAASVFQNLDPERYEAIPIRINKDGRWVLPAAPPRLILRNAYNDAKAVDWLAERIHAPVVLLPFSVGGTPEAKDLFGLFDDTINRLLAAIR